MRRIAILLIGLLAQSAFAQIAQSNLDKDPVFRNVISHRINYPVRPAARAIYGRFYAGFTINENGHIQNISVLYPKMSWKTSRLYGFEYEIQSGLKRMPPLNPQFAGSYLLPIAFCFTHYGEGANPIVPTNVLPQGYEVGDRFLLSEVNVFAKSPSSLRGLNGFPPSRQIADRSMSQGNFQHQQQSLARQRFEVDRVIQDVR